MPIKNEKVEAARGITRIVIKEFREKNPCDLSTLKPSFPSSLKKVDLSRKEVANLNLCNSPVVLSTLCGTIFGDASLKIAKNYKRARLSYRHSTRQTEWFMWKTLCAFSEFTTSPSVVSLNQGIQFQLYALPDGKQEEARVLPSEAFFGKWKVATRVSDRLTELHAILCPNNKKTVQRFWLNHMNNYFLMTLWLDDGALTGTFGRCKEQGVIATGEMPLTQVKLLADYFTTVWDINSTAGELEGAKMVNGILPTRLYISDQESLMKLLRLIAPIIPVRSMLYKVCFFPQDVSLQQRWASELKSLVRIEWHDDIDKIYFYKTLKFIS